MAAFALAAAVWVPNAVKVPDSAAPVATVKPTLTARGQLRPVAHARIATLAGGTVASLPVKAGQRVEEHYEIARMRLPGGAAEVLTAPWAGTITGLLVNLGDSLLPGTVVATIGDLSRLQVETTDVDEFIIRHVAPGLEVTVSVDALDGREFAGYVRTVALEPQRNESGDEHYLTVIDLMAVGGGLRPGMNVRIAFPSDKHSPSFE